MKNKPDKIYNMLSYIWQASPHNKEKAIQNGIWFIENLLAKERSKVYEEVIKLTDRIESHYDSSFDEWRGFKGIRNTLRDKLK